jgi:DNA-binding PadR family transcriptional regulator
MKDDNFSDDFGFFRGAHRARRGDIRPLILTMLVDKPMHGYEIISALEERSHGFWRPSAGTIYPNLQLLEEQEMVKSTEENGKKVYSLTEKGREEAKQPHEEHHGFGHHHHFKGGEMFMALRPTFKDTVELLRDISLQDNSEKVEAAKTLMQDFNEKLTTLAKQEA